MGSVAHKRCDANDILFLKPVISKLTCDQVESLDIPVSQSTTLQVTRSGQGVTLLHLSFFEPDDTFKCFNEIFLLLSIPALDPFFRDKSTKKLKKQFTSIVDNGPAEQPSAAIVQMCLSRLLLFLNLEMITQISFAEYHSKRKFVERVQAVENKCCPNMAHSPVMLFILVLQSVQKNTRKIWRTWQKRFKAVSVQEHLVRSTYSVTGG